MNWNERYSARRKDSVENRHNYYDSSDLGQGGVLPYTDYHRRDDRRRVPVQCGRCPQDLPSLGKQYKHPVFGRICRDCNDVLSEQD